MSDLISYKKMTEDINNLVTIILPTAVTMDPVEGLEIVVTVDKIDSLKNLDTIVDLP